MSRYQDWPDGGAFHCLKNDDESNPVTQYDSHQQQFVVFVVFGVFVVFALNDGNDVIINSTFTLLLEPIAAWCHMSVLC